MSENKVNLIEYVLRIKASGQNIGLRVKWKYVSCFRLTMFVLEKPVVKHSNLHCVSVLENCFIFKGNRDTDGMISLSRGVEEAKMHDPYFANTI